MGVGKGNGKWKSADGLFCFQAAQALNDFRNDGRSTLNDPFTQALLSVGSEVAELAKHGDHNSQKIKGVYQDEFLRGLVVIKKYGVILFSTVAQAQIYMDIFECIGARTSIGNNFAVAKINMLKAEADIYRASKFPTPAGDRLVRLAEELEEYFQTDNKLRYKLLNKLPLLAAKMVNDIVTRSRLAAANAANESLVLLSVAHLYKAAQCLGSLDVPWLDMDRFIKGQAMHGVFVHDADTVEGYARHHDIALGVKPSAFTPRNSRLSLPAFKKIGEQFRKVRPASMWTAASNDTSLAKYKETSGRARFYVALHAVANGSLKSSAQPRKVLPPIDLLINLEMSLVDGEPGYNFDFLTMYVRCTSFLMEVLRTHRHRIKANDSRGPKGVHQFVDDFLWGAAKARTQAQREDSILYHSGAALKELITTHGTDTLFLTAQKRSSGHIVPDRWPCKAYKRGGIHGEAKSVFAAVRKDFDPNMHKYNDACIEVVSACEEYEVKWRASGMKEEVLRRKVEKWVNAELKKRNISRKLRIEGQEHDKWYGFERSDREPEMVRILDCIEIGEETTVGELMRQG